MFSAAYMLCAGFTRPVVISSVRADGVCEANIGTFVHVNDEGWVVTAAHIVLREQALAAGRQSLRAHEQAVRALQADTALSSKQRRARQAAIGKADLAWPRDYSLWWSHDMTRLVDVSVIREADLAVGRLDPFDPSWVQGYPTFKDGTKETTPGTSLCRLGYPFAQLQPKYENGMFMLPEDVYQMPRFPNEGILTRNVHSGQHVSGYLIGYIETSSPGLMGQSGGPIFDRQGTVWGIQSQTRHFPLGFSPPVPGGKTGHVEHQFLNVGWGTHPSTITGHLRERGIRFNVAPY